MQSATPTKTVNNFHMESKSYKNIQYAQSESMENPDWKWKHPSIQESFFLKLEPPTSPEDAAIKMNCHQHAVKDFDLQIEMNELEMGMLNDANGEVLPYNESRMDELEQKKLKLLMGKRYNQNATNAYWYYLERSSK
jgi:hypothetical protein